MKTSQAQDHPRLSSMLLAVCAVALGAAIHISNGHYHPTAILLLIVSLLLGWGSLVPRVGGGRPVHRPSERTGHLCIGLERLLVIAVCIQVGLMLQDEAGAFLQGTSRPGQWMIPPLLVLAGLAGVQIGRSQHPWRWFIVLLVLFTAIGSWTILAPPKPIIDVWHFQQISSQALLEGTNPYTLTFPNFYGQDSPWYGPGVSVDGVLQFGYPYWPLTLLAVLPGYVLGGDVRWAYLVMMILTGVLLATMRPGRLSLLTAAVFLLTPRIFLILGCAWTEPLSVLLLTLTVWLALRAAIWVPAALGLFLASKQYVPVAGLLGVLLVGGWGNWRSLAKLWGWGALAAVVVTIPLALWNWPAFWYSTMELQFHQPFRLDSISFLAWWYGGPPQRLMESPPYWIPFVALLIGLIATLARCPHTPGGFAAAVGISFLMFFAFNKQAFANYYFLVIGSLCVALSAWQGGQTQREDSNTTIA